MGGVRQQTTDILRGTADGRGWTRMGFNCVNLEKLWLESQLKICH
jgi:hypothetical protein